MINIGKTSGFCKGVELSVSKTKEYLEKYKKIYCLGELVHNKEVVSNLEKKGLIVINNLNEVEDNSNVILRAHGVSISVYKEAKERNINILDLTCPKVLKIHNEVKKYQENGYFIILIGSKLHPETIGTISFAKEKSFIIEQLEDIKECIKVIEENKYNHIVVFVQTTFSKDIFKEITEKLSKELINKDLIIKNTICNATSSRQDECKKLSNQNDCMIIIGGKHSSNTKKLYDIASSINENTYIIETINDLDISKIKDKKSIGIMAGASTPKESIDNVIKILNHEDLK